MSDDGMRLRFKIEDQNKLIKELERKLKESQQKIDLALRKIDHHIMVTTIKI